MATSPVTPTPAPTIITTVEKDITWIKAHILLALLTVALVLGSIIGGVSLFESLIDKHDARVAASQDAKSVAAATTQAAILTQLQQEHSENLARDAAQTAVIQSLVTQMTQSRAATAKQVTVDNTLDAQSAAARLVAQTKAAPGDVTVSNDAVTMSLPLTRNVVASLDQLTQAQSDVTNLNGQLDAQKILTSDAKGELSTAQGVIAADKNELITRIDADTAACKVAVDKQASKDRKRGFWASVASFAAGLVVRGLL